MHYATLYLVIIYWILFGFCFIVKQKIYGVEMMFALQLTYMSYIPSGVYCPPFTSLSFLRYSFGWNGIDFEVSQNTINYYYTFLNIQSNFISNINLMMLILIICPLGFIILYILSKCFKH